MASSTRFLGWITLVLVLHMCEQMLFGLGELETLKRIIGVYVRLFPNPDIATVSLVTITAGLVFLGYFSLLKGGRARFVTLGALGLVAVSEVHHLIETAWARHYTAGTVTAIPFVVCGVQFLRALVKERRAEISSDSVAVLGGVHP